GKGKRRFSLSVERKVPDWTFCDPVKSSSEKREINVFNRRTSVPVAFTLSRRDGKPANDIKARLHVQRIFSMKPFGEPFDARPASGKNDGNTFRFDPEKEEYIYLMDASDLERGVWKLIVLLDDGSRQTTWIGIE
ncbi:MAG: hypothetical protein RRA32_02460, partial [bacterium]|nr:hypothetical protein [bacterium]